MTLTVSQWPFLPEQQRLPEQNERWWAVCYVRSPVDVTLRGIAHSVVVAGGPGSGKSTALEAFEKMEAERLLMFRYPVDRWPGEPHAWVQGYGHLGQIMACASMTVKNFLSRRPGKLEGLSKINLEYLRWLIEKYSGVRAFQRWADALDNQALPDLLAEPFDDLYPTDTALQDVQGQIEELVTLSRRFGFAGVAVLVDINQTEPATNALLEKMVELFSWLPPLQFEGFAIKAAIPAAILGQTQLINLSRGRITFTTLRWSSQECRELCNRRLQAATENKIKTLPDLASKKLLAALESQIEALYGEPLPRAWLRLTTTLLEQYQTSGQQSTQEQYEELIHTYFANYVPLKLDQKRRGVWRGIEFVRLDDQPFSFLEILWRHRDRGYANNALLEIAGKQGNLNTIASRLRKEIEPVPRQPVYLHNTRGQGYWLENVVEVSS